MKRVFVPVLAMLAAILFTFPAFASADFPGSESTETSSAPSAGESIFGGIGDDFFGEGDFIAFDEESLSSSSEIFRNSLGSVVNVALYGLLIVIGVFAVFEIIRSIAA